MSLNVPTSRTPSLLRSLSGRARYCCAATSTGSVHLMGSRPIDRAFASMRRRRLYTLPRKVRSKSDVEGWLAETNRSASASDCEPMPGILKRDKPTSARPAAVEFIAPFSCVGKYSSVDLTRPCPARFLLNCLVNRLMASTAVFMSPRMRVSVVCCSTFFCGPSLASRAARSFSS